MLGRGAGRRRAEPARLVAPERPRRCAPRRRKQICRPRAPIASSAATAARKVILIATGTEVEIAVDVAAALEEQGIGADVVSMPSTDRFDAQDAAYREDILPDVSNKEILRVSIEAGITHRLGTLHRASRPAHRARPLRRLGPGARPVREIRPHQGGHPTQNPGETGQMTKVAINGFGRIGRLVARAILSRTDHDLELVAINDLADAKANALLFKRDSVHGKWPGEVSAEGDVMIVDGKRIKVTAERDPGQPAAQGTGRRHRARMHRLLHRCRGRAEASRRGRQARADLGPGQGRRPDRRLWRQPRQAHRRSQDRVATPAAPPTASPRWPRCSTTRSASSAG